MRYLDWVDAVLKGAVKTAAEDEYRGAIGVGVGRKYDVEFESQPSRADARALNALTSGAGRALLRPVLRPPTGH